MRTLYQPPKRKFYIIAWYEFIRLLSNEEYNDLLYKANLFMSLQRSGVPYFMYYSPLNYKGPTMWGNQDVITIISLTRNNQYWKINSVFVFPRKDYNVMESAEIAAECRKKYLNPATVMATN